MNRMLEKAMGHVYQHSAAAAIAGGGGGGSDGGAAAPAAGGGGASAVVQPSQTGVKPADGAAGTQPDPATLDLKWLGDDAPDDLKGYVQNKGWKGPREVLDGYRNLEKVVGGARLAMPKDENDAEGWGKVYDALGRPKTATDYKLPVPEGQDGAFAKVASEVMHKAGLSAKQATTLATWWNEQTAAAQKAADEKFANDSAAAMQKIEQAWGGAYKEREETARRAARQFGIDEPMAEAMERGLGTEKFMDLMWRIGHAIGEHGGGAGLDGQRPGAGGALTPAQATAEIARLKTDPEFTKKYIAGGATERARMEQLHKWAAAGG